MPLSAVCRVYYWIVLSEISNSLSRIESTHRDLDL